MMPAARYRNIAAGVLLGSASTFVTFHLGSLLVLDPNPLMRTLKAAAFALVVPGLIATIVLDNIHALHVWIMAIVNFLFWFGFGWLFVYFVAKLVELRRAIAALGIPADGSLSAGRSDRSSSPGSR
jgi:hypothetical protein